MFVCKTDKRDDDLPPAPTRLFARDHDAEHPSTGNIVSGAKPDVSRDSVKKDHMKSDDGDDLFLKGGDV